MKHLIQQLTFDECVQENMSEFDMTREEATVDAINQFQCQGVDLSNLVISADARPASKSLEEQVRESVDQISKAWHLQENSSDLETLIGLLNRNLEMLSQSPQLRSLILQTDMAKLLVQSVYRLCRDVNEGEIRQLDSCCCALMLVLSNKDNKATQSAFGERMIGDLLTMLDCENCRSKGRVAEILRELCKTNERNKALLIEKDGISILYRLLTEAADSVAISTEVAKLIKALLTHSEPDSETSHKFEITKKVNALGFVTCIIELVRSQYLEITNPSLIVQWLSVLKELIITEASCKELDHNDGLALIYLFMEKFRGDNKINQVCLSILRNIAGVDELKARIAKTNGVSRISSAMQTHSKNEFVQLSACAALAALALRSVENSRLIIEEGGATQIACAVIQQFHNKTVVRQACLAIRNIVARSPDLRQHILKANVEDSLRQALCFRECGDEAYAALRDLGCDIKLAQYKKCIKARFNPVNIRSSDI